MKIPKEIESVIKAGVPLGSTKKVIHKYKANGDVCSLYKDAALAITRVHRGHVFNCFRCGFRGFIGKEKPSPDYIRTMLEWSMYRENGQSDLQLFPQPAVEEFCLPSDTIPMWGQPIGGSAVPSKAYSWCWRGGLKVGDIATYRFYWSPKLQRVIIPIFDKQHHLVAWCGRDPYTKTPEERKEQGVPKYIFTKDKAIDHRVYFTIPSKSDDDNVFIVEDILSAIRIHRVTECKTVALMNTKITNQFLLDHDYFTIYVWLDSDQLANMMEIYAKCQTWGLDCKYFHTEKDPKKYRDAEIEAILLTGGETDE